ncbi:chemotaxis protein CheA [bacterium]|nr:MAG: chemotaxis protein CheA [bacterium]
MNLDDALNTFVIESRELLENMEAALLQIEQAPDDSDLINAIFRAAHTIKGSAGLFGLDHVVSFTHNAENVLDMVRSGKLHIDGSLVAVFLDVCDHMGVLVELIAAGNEPSPEVHQRSTELVVQLKQLAGLPSIVNSSAPATIKAETAQQALDGVDSDNWHLSLRFNPDVLKNGMDPVAFIRYLTTLGDIASIVTLTDALPPATEMDPESCYFGFEINYRSSADKATIEGAFDFVRDDASIRILPPHSKIGDYQELIRSLPEEEMRLGEILVRCGTLTEAELREALSDQERQRVIGGQEQTIGEVLVSQHVVQPAVVEAALQKQKQVRDSKVADGGLIRVNAEKLDEHINLIGELIIASAGINLAAIKNGQPELFEAASVLNRLVENVRDSALQLRMVQIGATFNKFQRVVRDVSKEIGKDIRLEISGADTELDKTVVEKIGDPLTHLVRNSMDHGIEAEELRLARGKPAYGTLRLNAYHDSGSIVIEVSDDGGGLNKERILSKAIERGLVKPDQSLSDSEIYSLIFEPGFSTAEQVNNLSGRGVGMDVVRRNIVALRGSVEIDSTEGVGATMRIRLPLTLAIIDGFLVGVGNSSFVVPLEMVIECVELTQAEIEAAQGRSQLDLRGEVLPFIRLRELFDIPEPPPPERDEEEARLLEIDEELAFLLQPVKRENVVVVSYAGQRAGLVVDALHGEYQTVIRPLGNVFNGLQGVSGFTILGSGLVALILDVPGLVKRVARRETRRNEEAATYAVLD